MISEKEMDKRNSAILPVFMPKFQIKFDNSDRNIQDIFFDLSLFNTCLC